MKDQLNFEVFYPHPPERVWKALTDPAQLGQWLMPASFEPVIGSRFQFSLESKTIQGEVFDVVRERRLSYTWDDGEAGSPSVVRWTLSPKDGGTKLTLVHEAMPAPDSYVLIEARPNWGRLLGQALPTFLAMPVPIVYVDEEPEKKTTRKAGFRQEAAC